MKDTTYCRGCRDDFYNGQNSIGVKECWGLKTALVVTRWRQGWWDDPTLPGVFVEVETYSCHHEPGRFAFNKELPDFAVEPVFLRSAAEEKLAGLSAMTQAGTQPSLKGDAHE